MFGIDFYQGLMAGDLKTSYREMNIFAFKKIFIPICDQSYCFLIVFDFEESRMECYDPYDFGSFEEVKVEEKIEQNRKDHELLMEKLVDRYFLPMFAKKYPGFVPEVVKDIKIPPEIPVLLNEYDCGIYLIQFAKHIIFRKKPNFEPQHIHDFRDEIRIEIMFEKIQKISYKKKSKVSYQGMVQGKSTFNMIRRFENRSFEDCWLNATLQLILTGLDFLQDYSLNGSQIWEILMNLKNQAKDIPLSPLPIKRLLLEKDQDKVLNTGGKRSQLYLTNQSMQHTLSIGQQDARDFFVCIRENKEHWMDLFVKLSVKIETYTECKICKNRSKQATSSQHIFLEFECPADGTHMNEFIQNKLNQPESVTDWRDEDGCNKKGAGFFDKIKSTEESEFLIIIIKRVVNFGYGQQILRNKIALGGEATISDSQNKRAIYKPVAVLFHLGDVDGQETFGHYKADILDLYSSWFRTSDADIPRKISERNVSDQGYIYLYRKTE